jgi:hypothetical protein
LAIEDGIVDDIDGEEPTPEDDSAGSSDSSSDSSSSSSKKKKKNKKSKKSSKKSKKDKKHKKSSKDKKVLSAAEMKAQAMLDKAREKESAKSAAQKVKLAEASQQTRGSFVNTSGKPLEVNRLVD